MAFDIPKHAIQAFLALVDKENLVKNVWQWGVYMESFTTPGFVVNGNNLFTAQQYMNDAGYTAKSHILDAYQWRLQLLEDMFKEELTIDIAVGDRLVVRKVGKEYILSCESIGRMSQWCWINQLDDQAFPLYRPHDVLAAIVKSYNAVQ
jgi:hypothetical protein